MKSNKIKKKVWFAWLVATAFATGACGEKQKEASHDEEEIMGGTLASSSSPEAKSTVALLADYGNGVWNFRCSGTLIRQDVLLTAAHCLVNADANGITGLAAKRFALSLGGPTAMYPKIILEAESYAVRDGYKLYYTSTGRLMIPNDIALLFLKQKAPISYRPASLTYLAPGGTKRVSGYGPTSNTTTSKGLLYTGYMKYSFLSSDGTYAFTAKGTGACPGDSGGPLWNFENNRMVVYGVTSWSTACVAGSQMYSGFTDVRRHLTWLNSMLSAVPAK